MSTDLSQLQEQALAELAAATTTAELATAKAKHLGKKGSITLLLGQMGQLSIEERKSRGPQLNALRAAVTAAADDRAKQLQAAELEEQLQREAVDVTLPAVRFPVGGLHPINRVYNDLTDIFVRMGYAVAEGQEMDDEAHNFDALNIPWHHPARELQDTFWLQPAPDAPADVPRTLLRTHTSNMQIRHMVQHEPNHKILFRGKVYRNEATDATHESMFHQLEGLVVGDGIRMSDLRGTIAEMARGLYGPSSKVRFQPSYYPFVEPAADFAVLWRRANGEEKWLELGGCGMVHPNVFKAVDDLREAHGLPRAYEGKTGFAFGLGPERIAMLRYGIPDIRHFYANDKRVMSQFRGSLQGEG